MCMSPLSILLDFLDLSSGRTTATGTGECWRQYLEILVTSIPLNSDNPREPTIKSDGWYIEIMCWIVSCTLPITNSITTLICYLETILTHLLLQSKHAKKKKVTFFSTPLVFMILSITWLAISRDSLDSASNIWATLSGFLSLTSTSMSKRIHCNWLDQSLP